MFDSLAQYLQRFDRKLDRILSRLDALASQGDAMSKEMDDLVKQVKSNTDAEDSIETALAGIKSQLDAAIAAGADPAVLRQLSQDLETSRQKMIAAILANTPAAQPPAPTPPSP